MSEEFFQSLDDFQEESETEREVYHREEREWRSLGQISELLNASTFDIEHIFEVILKRAQQIVKGQRVLLFLADEEWRLHLSHPEDCQLTKGEKEFYFLLFEKIREEQQGAAFLNIPRNQDLLSSLDKEVEVASATVVPLKIRLRYTANKGLPSDSERRDLPSIYPQKIIGMLCADHLTDPQAFSPLKTVKLQTLANYAVAGIVNNTLHGKATLDPLTGLYQRPYFERLFSDEIHFSLRKDLPLALLMIDIDKFKNVNDLYGHTRGDEILQEISHLISCQVRQTDICARYGGDEFVVLLPQTPQPGAEIVAEKILEVLSERNFGPRIRLGASIGLSSLQAEDTTEKMAKRADQALYAAKREGGNRVKIWTPHLAKTAKRTDKLAGIFTGNVAQDYRNMVFLLEAISKANSSMKLEELMTQVIDMILEATTAERAIVILDEEEGLKIHIARDRHQYEIGEVTDFFQAVPRQVIKTGRSVSTTAVLDEKGEEERTIMCVPLMAKDNIFGVIYVDREVGETFSETDLAFFEALAQQIGLSMENVRLLEENMERAEHLKESMKEVESLNEKLEVLNEKLERKVDEQASELAQVRSTLQESQKALRNRFSYHNIIGKSEKMQRIYNLLDRIADSSVPVLICGKSGTGKELVAKAIHYNSPRREEQIVSENCAAVSESLLESELFGHVKGAFTGAEKNKKGLFEVANGGTLFLDEVGDMSLGMQTKLLRVLEEGEIRPLGSNQTVEVDVRIISATNKDLKKLVKEGDFRDDLYYRLNVVSIGLPPLSERREDIPLLIDHFLEKIARDRGEEKKTIDEEAMELLIRYDWPGNVRELENEVKKLVVFSDAIIHAEHLSPHIQNINPLSRDLDLVYLEGLSLKEGRSVFEQKFIEKQLDRFDCNVSKTARHLDITRQHLHRLIDQYNIPLDKLRNRS